MNALTLLLSLQLAFYLLIAQTGIVGVSHSQISQLFTLPLGGIVGALTLFIRNPSLLKQELTILLSVEAVLAIIYPHYSLGTLFVLGFIIGYMTPILLHLFVVQNRISLMVGLGLAYVMGTAMYGIAFEERGFIAIGLSLVSLFLLRYIDNVSSSIKQANLTIEVLLWLIAWIFLDTVLFETLARSDTMEIWEGFTVTIISFHLLGLWIAYRYTDTRVEHHARLIFWLFGISYLFYMLEWDWALAIVYPFVISFYNFLLFLKLIRVHTLRTIALAMLGIGWLATITANIAALNHFASWVGVGLWSILIVYFIRGVFL